MMLNPEIEIEVVDAVAGFLNSSRGGTLLIGVKTMVSCAGLNSTILPSVKRSRSGRV